MWAIVDQLAVGIFAAARSVALGSFRTAAGGRGPDGLPARPKQAYGHRDAAVRQMLASPNGLTARLFAVADIRGITDDAKNALSRIIPQVAPCFDDSGEFWVNFGTHCTGLCSAGQWRIR